MRDASAPRPPPIAVPTKGTTEPKAAPATAPAPVAPNCGSCPATARGICSSAVPMVGRMPSASRTAWKDGPSPYL